MERIDEFISYSKLKEIDPPQSKEPTFYQSFYYSLENLIKQIEKTNSIKGILVIEEKTLNLQSEINTILNSIVLEGSNDLLSHFEGIKQILNLKLVNLMRSISNKKNNSESEKIEIKPERPNVFRNRKNNEQIVEENKSALEEQYYADSILLEKENKKILEGQEYEQTKKQLLKIEQMQKAINENLLLQDERIDSICQVTSSTSKIYEEMAECDDFSSGSFFRRAATILLYCFSFILFFLYFLYNKK